MGKIKNYDKDYDVYRLTSASGIKSYIFSKTTSLNGETTIGYYLVVKSPNGEIRVEKIKDTLALLEHNDLRIEKVTDSNELTRFYSIVQKIPEKEEISFNNYTNGLKKTSKDLIRKK